MNAQSLAKVLPTILQWTPLIVLGVLIVVFGALSPRFLTLDNLSAVLVQSAWIVVIVLGMNFVLLTAGVDLSVGAVMYLAATVLGMFAADANIPSALIIAIATGAAVGAMNGIAIVTLRIPAFIATLAMAFVIRGVALFLSSTQMVFAGPELRDWGRSAIFGIPATVLVALAALVVFWALFKRTSLGPYARAIGADAESARRSGVPTNAVLWGVYILCGGCAGLAGLISFAQTSAATAAFGQNAEFLTIAAAVLGGASLYGGRGGFWGPITGALLVITVQNGLALINANPYAYPVFAGAVILCAAFLDSLRHAAAAHALRRPITRVAATTT
jgi:ribose transport system permease protein